MILVLAESEDSLAAAVVARLGVAAVQRIGPDNWNALHFTFELADGGAGGHVLHGNSCIAMHDISGVLVRALPSVAFSSNNESDGDYLLMEWSAALQGLLRALGGAVINRPQPGRNFRPPLLSVFAPALDKAGLRLPDMLVAHLPDEAREFLARHASAVTVLPDEDRRPMTGMPEKMPVCLIALPEGRRQRVAVVGRQSFGDINEDLGRRCAAAVAELGLAFAVLDLVSNPQGDWLIDLVDHPEPDDLPAAARGEVIGALAAALQGGRP